MRHVLAVAIAVLIEGSRRRCGGVGRGGVSCRRNVTWRDSSRALLSRRWAGRSSLRGTEDWDMGCAEACNQSLEAGRECQTTHEDICS